MKLRNRQNSATDRAGEIAGKGRNPADAKKTSFHRFTFFYAPKHKEKKC